MVTDRAEFKKLTAVAAQEIKNNSGSAASTSSVINLLNEKITGITEGTCTTDDANPLLIKLVAHVIEQR